MAKVFYVFCDIEVFTDKLKSIDLTLLLFLCSKDEICAAIKMGFNETRCVLEPAGALAIAGMVKYIKENKAVGCTYVAISSGANMDFDR